MSGPVKATLLLRAAGCSPGHVTGQVQTSADAALDASAAGADVILVVPEISPADQHVMEQVAGILTARGGFSSHAAIVARSLGIPAVCDARSIELTGDGFVIGGVVGGVIGGVVAGGVIAGVDGVIAGTVITINGDTGEVWLGEQVSEQFGEQLGEQLDEQFGADEESLAGQDTPEQDTVGHDSAGHDSAGQDSNAMAVDQASTLRGFQVFANADNRVEAQRARELGAAGIGLCRVEHIVNSPVLLALLRDLIDAGPDLDPDPDPDTSTGSATGESLLPLIQGLQAEFVDLLEGAGGLPVTVRLLDAPLHEISPYQPDQTDRTSQTSQTSRTNQTNQTNFWYERNPMLGIRGIRLAHLRPDIYQAQVTALANAAMSFPSFPGTSLSVLLPMVSTAAELAEGVKLVEQAWNTAQGKKALRPRIGVMIETPRAALIADQLAELADFFCIGTNDLSQFTFGFSRDDLDTRLLASYIDTGLLEANPFVTLDEPGVGELIALACQRGRSVNPELPVILCGEHGADEASLGIAYKLGVNAISCASRNITAALTAVARLG